jgi:hypothetical protein
VTSSQHSSVIVADDDAVIRAILKARLEAIGQHVLLVAVNPRAIV